MTSGASGNPATWNVPAQAPAEAGRLLLDELLAANDVVQASKAAGDQLIAHLLGEHWTKLIPTISGPEGHLPLWFSWRAAYSLHYLGHLTEAHALINRALIDVSPEDAPADAARLYAIAAAVAWTRGDAAACRTLLDQAGDYNDRSGDAALGPVEIGRALLAAIDGDRDDNLRRYLTALAWAERVGDRLTEERALNNLSSRAIESGDPVEALHLVERGMAINDITRHTAGLAVLRQNRSEALLTLGRLDEARHEADLCRELYVLTGSPSVAAASQLIGDIQARRGQLAQAEASYRHAVSEAEAEDDAQVLVPALAGLALTLVADNPTEARALTKRLEKQPHAVSGPISPLALGWVALHLGDAAQALAHANAAKAAAGRVDDLPRLAEALTLAALAEGADAHDSRLREALTIRAAHQDPIEYAIQRHVTAVLGRDELERRLSTQELHALGILEDAWRVGGPLHAVADLAAPTTEIQVHTLGNFAVYRRGVLVESTAWKSRKATEALRVLAAHTDRGLSRAELAEALWPGTDDDTSNRLSIALSHLRAGLDPDRSHAQDRYLKIERGRIQLDLTHMAIDIADFRSAARVALAATGNRDRALMLLETAAALHTGHFAEGESAEWSDPIREESDQLAQDINRALADLLRKGSSPEAALPWLARLLANDPFDEPGHLTLIDVLHQAGRFGEAARAHRIYASRMRQLGVTAQEYPEIPA